MTKFSEKTWNQYLKKYSNRFITKKAEDGEWVLSCRKYNTISLFSLSERLLMFSYSSNGRIKAKTYFLKRLEQSGLDVQIYQEGDWELTLLFKECNLEKVEDFFQIRKRRKFSEEAKIQLVKRGESLSSFRKAKFKNS